METSDILSERDRAHPPEELLERYVMGRCTDEECERLEEHFLICDGCRIALDEAEQWIRLMKAELPLAGEAEKKKNGYAGRLVDWLTGGGGLRSIPAMAGAALAVALITWLGMPYLGLRNGREGTPMEVQLSAVRGNDLKAEATSGAALRLRFEQANSGGTDLNGHQAAIVDAGGVTVWTGVVREGGVLAPKLQSGTYWVRLFSPAGQQVKEYGLLVK